MNDNDNILAYVFSDRAAAEAAAEALHEWDERVNDVKLGVIGLVYEEGGVVKSEVTHKAGFFKRSFPMSKEGVAALGTELTQGHVAVVVACDDYEVSMVQDSLTRGGGSLLAMRHERTAEEIADEAEAVRKAQAAAAADAAVQASRTGGAALTNRPT